MSCTASDRRGAIGVIAAALLLTGVASARAQDAAGAEATGFAAILSSQVGLSRDAAGMRLELEGGRVLDLEIRDGAAWLGGERIGAASRGGALDRAWRELLDAAMDAPTEGLPALLVDWEAPDGEAGDRLDAALEEALTARAAAAPVARATSATESEERGASDTVARLNARVAELEARLERSRSEDRVARATRFERDRGGWWTSPFRRIFRGIADILSILAVYAVLVGIGFGVVFFGRKQLEGVADTARHATVQAGLVGLAATFLVVPAFILGAIALTISIVGIPVLIAWLPLFPVAVAVAAIFGYLGVAHAAGEALAERRFYGGELFKRANSYYYVLTGVGLLMALYIAANVVQMAGPWLAFINGLLTFLAVVLTWAAFTIGFGAVLLSRAGTRPKVTPRVESDVDVDAMFEEESHV